MSGTDTFFIIDECSEITAEQWEDVKRFVPVNYRITSTGFKYVNPVRCWSFGPPSVIAQLWGEYRNGR